MTTHRGPRAALAAATTLVALTACSALGTGDAATPDATGGTSGGTVTLVTHESFGLSDGLLEKFERESGLTVQVVQQADAGALVNLSAFGVLAIMNDSDARSACPQPCINGSTQARTADDTTDRALVFANISNIALPVGLLALAVGGYLVLSAGPTEQPKVARAFVTPTLGGGGVGMRW